MSILTKHYESSILVNVYPEKLFSFVDDHKNLSSHMNKSSWMMGGGQMVTEMDNGGGQKVGSHITLCGKAFGFEISLDEVVTKHNPPFIKEWETVEYPKLLVIGNYRMGFEISPSDNGSKIKVFIDYEPSRGKTFLLGALLGHLYAKWCVHQMLNSAKLAK